MAFEWDEAKNQSNIAKHGISFEQAAQIFSNFTIDYVDSRTGYGEVRLISIGKLEDKSAVIVVVHTDRSGACRIISARQAKQKEKERYEQTLQQTLNGE